MFFRVSSHSDVLRYQDVPRSGGAVKVPRIGAPFGLRSPKGMFTRN
jgi:hypothetical protein